MKSMRIVVVAAVAVAVALLYYGGCGGTDSTDQAGTNSIFSLTGDGNTNGQVVRGSGIYADAVATIEGTGFLDIKNIADSIDLTCAFTVDTAQTASGIDIVSDSGACASANKCIVCTTAQVDGCQINCSGTVPSNAQTAADSFDITFTMHSLFHSDMPAPDGAIRFDTTVTDWEMFNPSADGVVTFNTEGCDGAPDMSVESFAGSLDGSVWEDVATSASLSRAYGIIGLDPDDDVGNCAIDLSMTGTVSLSGLDVAGATVSVAGGTITGNARICDDSGYCPAP